MWKPECLDKVIEKCPKLYSNEERTGKLLNKVSLQMFNKKQLTLDERKEVLNSTQPNIRFKLKKGHKPFFTLK